MFRSAQHDRIPVCEVGSSRPCPVSRLLDSENPTTRRGHDVDQGWVAQLVEQWTENPRVGGSIPPPAISLLLGETLSFAFCLVFSENAENERKCKFCISLASCHMLSSSSDVSSVAVRCAHELAESLRSWISWQPRRVRA